MNEIKNINIIGVFRNAGIQVKRTGKYYKCVCPFHSDKDPSMVLYESNTFHCFGCGAGGDSATFVMKYYNVTFLESLKQLNISEPDNARVRDNMVKNKLISEFGKWEHQAAWTLTRLIDSCDSILSSKRYYLYSDTYELKETWAYWLDILYSKNKKSKYDLHKYLKKHKFELFELPEQLATRQVYNIFAPKQIIEAWFHG